MTDQIINIDKPKTQLNKKRCYGCNAKVGLLGFKCRCKGHDDEHLVFCSGCRIPKHKPTDRDGHNCDFDYRKLGKDLIEKNNQKVDARKIDVI